MAAPVEVGPLERGPELDRINAVFDQARLGRGRRLVVVGPPGIGKSYLVDQAATTAGAHGLAVMTARAGVLERDYPFGVVLRLLEKRFVRADDAELKRLLRGRAGLAGSLLGGAMSDIGKLGHADEFSLIHGLYWAVVNLAEERPLALLVDDVHWADDLSLRFLAYLGQRLDDLPVALLLGFREHDDDGETARLSALAAVPSEDYLSLAELSPGGVARILAAARIPAARRDDLVDAAWQSTRGNPFLVHEVVAAMRQAPERWVDAAPDALTMFAPEAVARSVVLRLSQLGPEALALARTCAILGDGTPLSLAAALADLDAEAASTAVHRLVARGILADPQTSTFHHPVIRAAVYDDMPATARSAGHSAAANALLQQGAGAAEVAGHILNGNPTQQRWAHRVLHDAGRAAVARGAPDVAARYLRRAVEWSAPTQREAAMLLDLGLAEAASGRTTSLRRFEEALTHVGDDDERARTLYALGQTLHRYGRHGEALEVFRRGTEMFAADGPRALLFEGGVACSASFVAADRPEYAARLERVAASLATRKPYTDAERTVLAALAVQRALIGPDLGEAARLAELALDGHPLMRDEESDDIGFPLIVAALLFCERGSAAAALVDRLLAQARRRGSGLAVAEGSYLQAMVMHSLGRLDEARTAAEQAIDGTSGGWRGTVPAPQAFLVDCLIEVGDLEAAQGLVQSGEMEPAGPEASGLNAWFLWSRGQARMAGRDVRGALQDFLEAGRHLEPFAVRNPTLLPWRPLAAEAASLIGDRDGARELIDREIELARELGLCGALGVALRVRARVEEGERSAEALEESIAELERSERPLELARALFDQGRALRIGGERVAARVPLRRALDIAHRSGASRLAKHIHDELLAAGARPRRAVTTGAEALTASERRIAELAAEGQTNRMIAETLLLTKNTIEWHLRAVFRKLGVTGREQISGALAPSAEGRAR